MEKNMNFLVQKQIDVFTERKACWEKGKISRFRHHAASNFARFYRGLFSQQNLSPERAQRR